MLPVTQLSVLTWQELSYPMDKPLAFIELLENWIPGIQEPTELHDCLHVYYGLGFSINDEARLLGFQLGHHPAGNFFHVIAFVVLSTTVYPSSYRNSLADVQDFYRFYLLGKHFQSVSYWFVPVEIFRANAEAHQLPSVQLSTP